MSDLLLNVKQAFHSLIRAPLFTITALLTLALGIGATTAMFATLYAALWKPLPFENPERLVLPRTTFSGDENPWTSAPDFFDYREQAGCFEYLTALANPGKVTVTGERAERLNITFVSPDFFQMIGTKPVAGRWFSPAESAPGGPPTAVVSEGFARRRFGSPQDALGKSLVVPLVNASYPIVGVSPANLDVFSATDFWVPFRKGDPGANDPRGAHNWELYGRLKPGVSVEAAQRQVDVIARRLEAQYPDTNKNKGLKINPLQQALLGEEKSRLTLLMGGVSLLLLIACGNVAGLMLARGASRRTELAVRATLGASRGRLVAQLLTESVVLSVLSGLAGIVLAHFLLGVLPVVSGLAEQGIPSGKLDGTVMVFALGVSVLTGVLFGIVPAFRAASKNLSEDLVPGRRSTSGKGGSRLRGGMVVAQVALSLVLLVGSGMLVRSTLRLYATPLGFDTRQLLTGQIELPEAKYPDGEQRTRFFAELQEELRAVPGVRAVGFVSRIPLVHTAGNIGVWTPETPPENRTLGGDMVTADRRFVLPGYFDAMGIPLLSGRDLSSADGPDTGQVMVISELMARTLYRGQNPLGRTVIIDMMGMQGDPAFQVVGVVGNARIDSISRENRPVMYCSFRQFAQSNGLTHLCPMIRAGLPPQTIAQAMGGIIGPKDRDIPVETPISMDQHISKRLASRRVAATTMTLFSAVALLLASLGLYGVLSFLVGQRTREIGVRMALGARVNQVVWAITRSGLLLAALGMVLGTLGSLAMGKILASQLYQVSATDPASILLGSLALGMVALLASLIPALQAARVDPVVALRTE